jgi:hypothetical protein
MTVPGVNVICAATFMAAIGAVGRFSWPRKLVGYLGVDPRVIQSGASPATHGRISKQGSVPARHALVEASWSVVRQPGPLHAFYARVRSRRGPLGRDRRHGAQARLPVLVPADPRGGLRLPAALTDGEEAAATRDPRRRANEKGHCERDLADAPEDASRRTGACRPGRVGLPADGRRLAAHPGEEEGRRRDTGARILRSPIGGQASRRAMPQASL